MSRSQSPTPLRGVWRGGLREARLALFLGMELAWVTGLALLIATRLPPPLLPEAPAFAWVVAVPAWAWLVSRLLRPERWPVWAGAAAAGTALAAGLGMAGFLLLSDPMAERDRAIALAVVGGLAGLRGWLLASRDPDREGFVVGFQVGGAVLLLVVALGTMLALPVIAASLTILAFLACGLLGLWLTGEGPQGGESRPHASGALAVVAVLLLGGAAVALVDRAVVDQALALVVWAWEAFQRLLAFIASLLPESDPGEIPPMEAPPGVVPTPASEPRFALFEGVRPIAEFVFIAIWIGLIGAVLLRSILALMRWLGRRRTPSPGLVVTESRSGLWGDLRLLLNWLWLLLLGLGRRLSGRLVEPLATSDPARRHYRRFLAWSALRGLPRNAAATPDEHRAQVARHLPSAGGVADAVLAAYLPARYGPGSPSPAALAAAETAIRRLGRRGVKAKE